MPKIENTHLKENIEHYPIGVTISDDDGGFLRKRERRSPSLYLGLRKKVNVTNITEVNAQFSALLENIDNGGLRLE